MTSLEKLEWPELLSNLAVGYCLCFEIAVRAHDDAGAATNQTDALKRAHALIVSKLLLPTIGPPVLWQRFLWLRRLTADLLAETIRRLGSSSATEALVPSLVAPEANTADLERFQRAIRPRKVARWEDDQRQRAAEGAVEVYQGLGQIYAAAVPMQLNLASRQQLGLAELPDNGWNWPLFYRNKLYRILAAFGPFEQQEQLRKSLRMAAREGIRADWEKAAAAKRVAGTEDIDELLEKGRERLFLDTDGSPPELVTSEDELAKKMARDRKIAVMERLHGSKGANVARALFSGASIAQAAKTAGVSKSQARRYFDRLVKI